MKNTKTLMFAIALAAFGCFADEVTPWTIENGVNVPLTGHAVVGNCKIQTDGVSVGSTRLNSTLTIQLNNPTAGDMQLSWKGGAKDIVATYTVEVSDANGYGAQGAYTQEITGSWTPTTENGMTLLDLPAGDLTLVLTINSTTGSYAGNYGNFTFTSISPVRYDVTVPSVDHATSQVAVDGVSITRTGTIYPAVSNSTVVAIYTPEAKYELSGTTNFTFTAIDGPRTVENPPTAKLVNIYTEGSVVWADSDLLVASAKNSTGLLEINGGEHLVTNRLLICRTASGDGDNARGTVLVQGGTLTVPGGIFTGWRAGSISTFRQSGGAVELGAAFEPGWGGNTTGIVEITGGTLHATALNPCNYEGSCVTMSIGGDANVTIDGNVRFFNRVGSNSATLSITGGVFTTQQIYTQTTGDNQLAQVILNGGTLRAGANNTAFIEDDTSLAFSIGANGGTIDTQGYNVTIPAAVSGTGVNLTKQGSGKLTFTNASLFTGTITVLEGCGSVVVPNTVTGIACGTYTQCTEVGNTKVFTYDYGPSYVFENGATNNTAISGRGIITINNALMNADISEFTGIIYVNGNMHIGPNFQGAAKAKWIVQAGIYLYDIYDKSLIGTAATNLQFGAVTYNGMHRIYMFHGEQDCTIEIGALNQDDSIAQNDGIGGYYWNALSHEDASVTVKKVGTGTLTSNLAGAREWIVESGAVNFVPLTQTEINVRTSNDMYQTTCNRMTVKSGAEIGGFYGPLPKSGINHSLVELTVEEGATFTPDIGRTRTWCVKDATLDGATLNLVSTGKLVHGSKYTILTAADSLSAENLNITGSSDFVVSVEGNSIVATYNGYGKRGLTIIFR